jgi:hypothetical protein
MQHDTIQDRISRGYGSAARAVGAWCDVYRPTLVAQPLDGRNHLMRLSAAFLPLDGRVKAPVGHGHVTWQGLFDAAYTRPGDFIVRPSSGPGATDGAIFFIAAQQLLLPPLCVRTSSIIQVVRSIIPNTIGAADYGGAGSLTSVAVLSNWPASIVHATGSGLNPLDLPATVAPGSWELLFPTVSGLVLRINDRISDHLGRNATVAAAELSDLGWRVITKEIAS